MTRELGARRAAPQSGTARHLVVLLHGYGSDANDLIGLAPVLAPVLPDALFVALNAPDPCGLGMGYQWFAIGEDREFARMAGAPGARPGIEAALAALWAETGLGPEDTVLGGFSQGAMMALDVGLRQKRPLAGILAFSGALIGADVIGKQIASRPPVALVHGDRDDVVPLSSSIGARETLAGLGVDVVLHVSRGAGHSIAPDGLAFGADFLGEVLDGGDWDGPAAA